jgi:hypothetical protein
MFDLDQTKWRPASGMRSKAGRSLWRVVHWATPDGATPLTELEGRAGRVVTFGSLKTAQTRVEELNLLKGA